MTAMISTWRQIQRENFTQWDNLADFLELSSQQRDEILIKPTFALNLPRRLADKIEKRNLKDPILKQFLPIKEENKKADSFVLDPVGDELVRKKSKLLHKYQGRALLIATSACAMHCRYCFRQNFSYETETKGFKDELEILAADSSIHEIILSGGDPLSLNNTVLKNLINALEFIPHLRRLRFHSRFPIGIPERIDQEFLAILENSRFQIWFVIHCNHPNELDADVFYALKKIQKLGIPVLNQAVLLKDVNDEFDTLKTLCELLVNQGVFPYYLHQLDRVQGAHHFEVNEEKGHKLINQLVKEISGYAVPKYVREISGEPSKTALLPILKHPSSTPSHLN